MKTEQVNFWKGNFGKEYTDRNSYTEETWDEFYRGVYGITKIEMNSRFIDHLSKDT